MVNLSVSTLKLIAKNRDIKNNELIKILSIPKSKISLSKKRIKEIREEFNKLRHRFSKSKLKEIRRNFYEIKSNKNLFKSKKKFLTKIENNWKKFSWIRKESF